MNDDERPWFAPKRYGYGPGMPIAWQGWVMLGAHIALILALMLHHPGRSPSLILLMLVVALAPIPFYARKTAGGWRWHWGEDN